MSSLRESNGSSSVPKIGPDNEGDEDGDGEGNDDQEDADGEEKPKPKRRKYVRRDQARRKEQNAQAQKKFRQKKKKLAEQVRDDLQRGRSTDSAQMKTDLDEALERATMLAEKLDKANEQIAAMGVEINQLRLGMMKCKCVGPDT